jgi:adenosylcobyric acid synthase
MLQGTGSDVGKSLLVAGLCRAFTRRGLAVRPFKPQNMSNNAAVTADGGEIGRAQALQARACGVPALADMNPVLLKPETETGAQVVVQGRVESTARARDYHALKPRLMPRVLESFARLRASVDLVLIEGAGSPAEVNLRAGDIANMGFAEAAGVPVILVADIDRGGVIASLVGTHALLDESERARLRGYVVNKFRGDVSLFDAGLAVIGQRTGLPCFGVVPYWPDARRLPKEDALALDNEGPGGARSPGSAPDHTPESAPDNTPESARDNTPESARDQTPESARRRAPIRVVVPRLARIANFDDLDPLAAEADVRVSVVEAGSPIPGDADVVLLPGSKATLADLAYLRNQGWDVDIRAHVRRGGRVVGLCGGYQMLGRRVRDPDGVEGAAGEAPGLGLLDVETVITGDKTLEDAHAVDAASGEAVTGFEMHMGLTEGPDRARPWMTLVDGRHEGAVSADGRVMGCYLHGLFAADGFRRAFLGRLRKGRGAGARYEAGVEAALDGLADHLETHLDLDALLAAAE